MSPRRPRRPYTPGRDAELRPRPEPETPRAEARGGDPDDTRPVDGVGSAASAASPEDLSAAERPRAAADAEGPDAEGPAAEAREAAVSGTAAPATAAQGGGSPDGEVPEETVVAFGQGRGRRARIPAQEIFDDGGPGRAGEDSGEDGAAWDFEDLDDELADGAGEDAEPLPFPEPEVVGTRRRRRRRLAWGSGLLAVLLAVVAVLYFSPLLTIHHVHVERNDLLTDERAQELLQPLYGRPLPQVGNAQVQDLLAEEAVVEDVIVQGELPDSLTIEVIEHPPVAEVAEGDGLLFYNEHGEVIRTFEDADDEAAEGYATPRISNEAALQHEAVFRSIVGVLGQLPSAAREAMDSATADSIDSVQLILDDGRTVVWGGEERGQEKAVVLEAILASEAEDFTEADTIDISTPDTPVTR